MQNSQSVHKLITNEKHLASASEHTDTQDEAGALLAAGGQGCFSQENLVKIMKLINSQSQGLSPDMQLAVPVKTLRTCKAAPKSEDNMLSLS